MIRFSGILGLVLFGFGFIGWWQSGFNDLLQLPLILGHLVLGIVLTITWFFSHGVRNVSSAGAVVTGRTSRYSTMASVNIALFVALLAAVNWFANRFERRKDLTEEQVYSLAPQTSSILKNLKRPLRIVAMLGLNGGRGDEEIQERLRLYTLEASDKVTTELVDVRSKPHLVDSYEMKAGNLVYLAYGEGEKKAVSRLNENSEEAITNGILKLTRGEAKKLYYVTGHGEPELNGTGPGDLKRFAEAIADEHMVIEPIFIGEKPEVPADAAAVIFVSPKKELLPQERETLVKYAEKGGHLLMLSDPRTTDDIREIASHFNIDVGQNVIIDLVQRLFDAPALGAQPMVTNFATHPVTMELMRGARAIFNIASTVSAKENKENGVTVTELMKSGPSAWGESNLDKVFDPQEGSAELDEKDVKGPVSLAVAYERKLDAAKEGADSQKPSQEISEPKTARVVVFGDSDWMLNANLNVLANRDLILNALNWVAGEEGGVSLRPKSMKQSTTPIGASEFNNMLIASFLLPELLLIVGLFISWSRRNRPMLSGV